jgi:hypothetical protein
MKGAWWLKNVYRGDMPQLTWRSAFTGVLGVLAPPDVQVLTRFGDTVAELRAGAPR